MIEREELLKMRKCADLLEPPAPQEVKRLVDALIASMDDLDAAEGAVQFLLTLVPEWAQNEEPGLPLTMYGTGTFEGDKVIIDKVKAIKAEWEKP